MRPWFYSTFGELHSSAKKSSTVRLAHSFAITALTEDSLRSYKGDPNGKTKQAGLMPIPQNESHYTFPSRH